VADGGVTCTQGHHFDVAREGYLNLLASNRRRGEHEGDSRAMLLARRAFLAKGYYDPISRAVAEWVGGVQLEGCVVDAGCGDGFYLGRIETRLADRGGPEHTLIGLDVAKDATRLAARARPSIAFVVGDVTSHLPLRDGCAGVVLSIFAPRHAAEFGRVLRLAGQLLIVIPTDEHLGGLREQVPLLRVEPEKREHIVERLSGDFVLTSILPVRYEITLDGTDAALLVRMGPTARHLAEAKVAALAARPARIATLVSVELLAFRRRG
jgi:23S rRNA (guanine745-N1)-methyltransferase